MAHGESRLLDLINEQLELCGAREEISPNAWGLFAIPVRDQGTGHLARGLLEQAPFTVDEGTSEEGDWTLFYVDGVTAPAARHWLRQLRHFLTGEALQPSPAQLKEIGSLLDSPMPHRVARALGEAAQRGDLPGAAIGDPQTVRALLDRLHQQEPSFIAALHQLMQNHVVDLLVLHRALIAEDLAGINLLTQGGVSHDPFFLGRQTAAAGLRQELITAKILNPLDQAKHDAAHNPYAALAKVRFTPPDTVELRVDSMDRETSADQLRQTIRKIRSRVYRGESVLAPETRAPWATDERAYHLRFVRQFAAHPPAGRTPLDWLYLLERSLAN